MDPTNNNNDKMGKEGVGGRRNILLDFSEILTERFQLVIKKFDFAWKGFVVVFLGRIVSPPPLKTNSMPDTFTFSFDHNFSCTAQFKDEGFAVSFSLKKKKENTNIKTSFEAWGASLI